VLEVTGRPAEDFETIARRYAAAPQCKPTMANRLRQVTASLVLPLRPGYDLNAYARTLNMPQPQGAEYAMQSDTWLREHELAAPRLHLSARACQA
jgi:NAD(P)H dehydrogenase (quinone)